MEEKIKELLKLKEEISLAGGREKIDKRHREGRMTARERIAYLLDEDSFVEVAGFVKTRSNSFDLRDKKYLGDGVVTGYGTINSRPVYVYSQDFTILGGSLGLEHARKITRIQDMAIKTGAPIIGIHDSGGARIQEGVDSLAGYGEIFYNNTRASGVVPQISVIMGPSAGGAVYSPALTDFIFMVENTGRMFITGPDVIKAVTGEEVSQEELGGARTHGEKSGVCHFSYPSEEESLARVRELLSLLPSNNLERPPLVDLGDRREGWDEDLASLLPEDPSKPYDIKALIRSLSDQAYFFEVQEDYAKNIVVGFIRLDKKVVGVVANQPLVLAGCLDINASDKASRFIRTCDAYNIPLLTLVDVPGFLPGLEQEYGGVIRHGAKLLYGYSEARVAKLSLIVRKAYGGAYIAMCSKHLGADLVYSWPTAEIAVMGPEAASNIIHRKEISSSPDREKTRRDKAQDYKDQVANPYIAAERGYVDDIILPGETRSRLISGYRMLEAKREESPRRKHGNIPL